MEDQPPRLPAHTVLVADDDADVARVVELALRPHHVVHALNGRLALDALDRRSFDLVLSDVAMPELDGAGLLAEIQRRPDPPPVLILTGAAQGAAAVELLRSGAVDLLDKPFSIEELRARVENVLASVRLRRQLATANDALEVRNNELDRYAAHVAHDLRGPLSVAAGFARLLASDGTLPQRFEDPADRIVRATTRAERLVAGLLEDATGGTRRAVPLRDVVLDVAAELHERSPALVVDVDDDLPAVLGRQASLRQLTRNLLGNAVAYAGDGPPSVTVQLERVVGGRGTFLFADRGIGVPPEERSRVLAEGERGSATTDRPGQGLGLSAARAVAEAHGGSLHLADGPDGPGGPGVTVVVRLPLAGVQTPDR